MDDNHMQGRKVIVTAGGTREPIDPVRFIGNRSSGKMGFALASAAANRGALVCLISTITPPSSLKVEQIHMVETVAEMRKAVLTHYESDSILIMAAAVSDFRAREPASQKIKKKNSKALSLELVQNDDFLLELDERGIKIGFAAETENLIENAAAKLNKKGLAMICANDVSQLDAGFEVDTNRVSLLHRSGKVEHLPLMSKLRVANSILDRVGPYLTK